MMSNSMQVCDISIDAVESCFWLTHTPPGCDAAAGDYLSLVLCEISRAWSVGIYQSSYLFWFGGLCSWLISAGFIWIVM